MRFSFLAIVALACMAASAVNFSGFYSVALCSNGKDNPCGLATLSLIQTGNRVCGDHSFVTAGGGRLNDGFPGSVIGVTVGQVAILTIKSGRNDGIVIGKAVLKGKNLYWQTLEQVQEGVPQGDALIFGKGLLKRVRNTAVNSELVSKCRQQ
jgi:hypothetical protein